MTQVTVHCEPVSCHHPGGTPCGVAAARVADEEDDVVAGVSNVWVPVEDMDRALGFYRDVLGLSVTMSSPEWSELDAGGLSIGLNARETASAGTAGTSGAVRPAASSAAAAPRRGRRAEDEGTGTGPPRPRALRGQPTTDSEWLAP